MRAPAAPPRYAVTCSARADRSSRLFHVCVSATTAQPAAATPTMTSTGHHQTHRRGRRVAVDVPDDLHRSGRRRHPRGRQRDEGARDRRPGQDHEHGRDDVRRPVPLPDERRDARGRRVPGTEHRRPGPDPRGHDEEQGRRDRRRGGRVPARQGVAVAGLDAEVGPVEHGVLEHLRGQVGADHQHGHLHGQRPSPTQRGDEHRGEQDGHDEADRHHVEHPLGHPPQLRLPVARALERGVLHLLARQGVDEHPPQHPDAHEREHRDRERQHDDADPAVAVDRGRTRGHAQDGGIAHRTTVGHGPGGPSASTGRCRDGCRSLTSRVQNHTSVPASSRPRAAGRRVQSSRRALVSAAPRPVPARPARRRPRACTCPAAPGPRRRR